MERKGGVILEPHMLKAESSQTLVNIVGVEGERDMKSLQSVFEGERKYEN